MKIAGVKKTKGSVLVLVVMVVLVLAVLSRATVLTAAQQGVNSRAYLTRSQGVLLAEAANQFVLDELSRDSGYEDDITAQKLQAMKGTFSVDFVTAGATKVESHQSVNNLSGLTPVNGPRGKGTVPAGTLDLVVTVELNGVSRQYESIIARPTSSSIQPALGSTGKIVLQGDVSVDGIQSVSDDQPVDGDVHSSFSSPTLQPIISWAAGGPGDSASITGRVAVTSPSSTALSMGGASVDGGLETGFAVPPLPDHKISGTVASKSGATALVYSPFGDASVSAGEHYAGGNVSINGDLVLNGTDLYVKGDLSVNGSIRGEGTVWVDGETRFRGDSSIRVGNDDSISLLSRGNVRLEGFSGLEYLESFVQSSGDPKVVKALADTKDALNAIEGLAESNGAAAFARGESADKASAPWRRVLGDPPTTRTKLEGPPPGYDSHTLGTLRDALGSAPDNGKGTRAFMVKRLDQLQKSTMESIDAGGDTPARVEQALAEWERGDFSGGGYWDYLTEYTLRTGKPLPPGTLEELYNFASQLTVDRLGSSSFQGTIFTDGAFLAEHEVTVLGQIQASGRNDDAGSLQSSSGKRIEPGDIYVGDGCHVTFCQQYAEESEKLGSSGGFQVSTWLEP